MHDEFAGDFTIEDDGHTRKCVYSYDRGGLTVEVDGFGTHTATITHRSDDPDLRAEVEVQARKLAEELILDKVEDLPTRHL